MRIFCFILLTTFCNLAFANPTNTVGDYDPLIYLWLVFFIFFSRGLSIVKKIGLPLVIGEIFTGIILGDLNLVGITLFKNADSNVIIKFLAEFGAIILMFEIGLESKFSDLKRNFKSGIKVAIYGSVLTFAGGYLVSALFIRDSTLQLNLLFGIITAATATGISAKTFKEMNILQTTEVRLVMVASILDEVISVFCFAIISALIINQTIELTQISISIAQVIGFFIITAIFAHWITPFITTWSTRIHAGINMKIGVLLVICFFFSWLSHVMGLATVIGAFIAGLILDEIYFKSFSRSSFLTQLRQVALDIPNQNLQTRLNDIIEIQEHKTLEELLKPLSHVFVPVFFIYIGLMLDIQTLFQLDTLKITLALLVVSFIGRILSGYLIKGKNLNRLIIGIGMTPIGEAGLIFAVFGKNVGLISSTVLSAVVATLVISAVITPILIKIAIKFKGINHGQIN